MFRDRLHMLAKNNWAGRVSIFGLNCDESSAETWESKRVLIDEVVKYPLMTLCDSLSSLTDAGLSVRSAGEDAGHGVMSLVRARMQLETTLWYRSAASSAEHPLNIVSCALRLSGVLFNTLLTKSNIAGARDARTDSRFLGGMASSKARVAAAMTSRHGSLMHIHHRPISARIRVGVNSFLQLLINAQSSIFTSSRTAREVSRLSFLCKETKKGTS
jgi:hypothetical protein